MWNNRPDGELPKSFEPPTAAGSPTAKTNVEPSSKSAAVIGSAVKIVGEIYSNEDLLIEGFVQGTVEAVDHKLTVGRNGTVHARVQVREADVQGSVQGNVEATERIDIRKDAKLVGDIKAARIVIEDGAYFNGRIEIVRPEPNAKPQPARSSASSATPAPKAEELELMLAGAR